MKSIAAYYTFVAIHSLEQEALQRREDARAAEAARPSLLSRVRALFGARSSQPAPTAA
jgi:hypothetical protein